MENDQLILDSIEKLSNKIDAYAKGERRSTELNELFAALAKAQAEMPIAGKNNANPFYKSKYSDLCDIVKASRPALSKNGLSVLQQMLSAADGSSTLYTILAHSSGQYIATQMKINPPKNDIQAMGSYISYLRRYSYACLIGVVSSDEKEDDDGESAVRVTNEKEKKGTAINQTYDPRNESYDTVNETQISEFEYELEDYPDIYEKLLEGFKIQSISDLPQSKYRSAIDQARKIKAARESK